MSTVSRTRQRTRLHTLGAKLGGFTGKGTTPRKAAAKLARAMRVMGKKKGYKGVGSVPLRGKFGS